jgi:ribonuclease P protein component
LPDAGKKDAIGSRSPKVRSDQRFPGALRLVRRSEFEAVYRSGRRCASEHFVVFGLPNTLPHCRFGISVKRALGSAVRRNRIRRRTREILRRLRPEMQTGWDIVVHPRSLVATKDFAALYRELHALLRELTLRR